MTEAQNLIDGICKNEQDTESVWLTLDNMCVAEMQEFMDEIKLLVEDANKWREHWKISESIRKEESQRTPTYWDAIRKEQEE